jgi:hypothetical protein
MISIAATSAALGGCSESRNTADWNYATSTDVLGLSLADIEKRLGKPAITSMPAGSPITDFVYKIGECSVVFNIKANRIWRVHVPLDQPCTPGLGGVDIMKDAKLKTGVRYADMPASLMGTWRANCMAPFCQPAQTIISFISNGDAAERRAGVALETQLVTPQDMAARNAWAVAIIGRSDVYSAELDKMAICGTANQERATPILNGLKITAVNFGFDIDEARLSGCPAPNAPVSISGRGKSGAAAAVGTVVRGGFHRNQIIGAWVPKGDSCESDVGILFDRQGSWSTLDESGTWELNGDKLTIVTAERRGDGEEMITLRPGERSVGTIRRPTQKEMVQHFPDQVIDLVRCP